VSRLFPRYVVEGLGHQIDQRSLFFSKKLYDELGSQGPLLFCKAFIFGFGIQVISVTTLLEAPLLSAEKVPIVRRCFTKV
jgi:hypothetical protein